MKELESLNILNNSYYNLKEIESKIHSLIDKEGDVVSSLAEIKKIGKSIPNRPWQKYSKFLNSYQKLIQTLAKSPSIYLHISLGITIELKRFKAAFSNIFRIMKSVKIKFPKSNIFEQHLQNLEKLRALSDSLEKTIQDKWEWDLQEDYSTENFIQIFKSKIQFPVYNQTPSLWAEFLTISNPDISFSSKFPPDYLIFQEFALINNWISSNKKKKEEKNIKWDNFFHSFGSSSLTMFQYNPLYQELLYFLFQQQILQIQEKKDKLSSKDAKKIQKLQEERISEILGCLFVDLIIQKKLNADIQQFQDKKLKIIQHHIPAFLQNQQDLFLKEFQGDLSETNKSLQNFSNTLFEILNQVEEWVSENKAYIYRSNNAIKAILSIVGQIRGDIAQFIEDFDNYAQSIKQNKDQLELEKKIEQANLELESLLRNYQLQTIPVIESNFPDFSQLIQQINQYKENFLNLQESMNSVFIEYQKKGFNVLPLMETWMKKFESITNQASFTIRNTLTSLFSKYKSVLQSEQEFFETLSGYNSPDSALILKSLEILQPDRMSEADLRKQIEKIDQKLQKIDTIKNQYLLKREKLSSRLEDILKDHGLESKKCVICHQLVNVAEDNYIKCEFCGSLSHYTCAVWWIEKYNSCPVCHNKYTIPNNELFDPNQVEH